MDVVAKEGLIRQRVDLLVNQLVVAVRSDSRLLWRRRPISRSPGCAGLPSGIRRAFRPVSTRNSSWKRLACGDAWSPRSFHGERAGGARGSRVGDVDAAMVYRTDLGIVPAACGRLSRRCPSRAVLYPAALLSAATPHAALLRVPPIAGCGRHLPASRVRLRGLQRRPRPGGRESRVTPELLQVAAFTVVPPRGPGHSSGDRDRVGARPRSLSRTRPPRDRRVAAARRPARRRGLLLLYVFGRRGPLGASLASAGLDVVFTWRGVVLAMAVMGLPLVVAPRAPRSNKWMPATSKWRLRSARGR